MGNLDSVARAVEECGGRPLVTNRADILQTATHIILPGVGAFPLAMRHIRERQLDKILTDQVIQKRIPFLGLCLGMQLLATTGHEIEETPGFGWIPGQVQRLQPLGADTRIPHIGWNEVHVTTPSQLFAAIPSGKDFYFVHSYHLVCSDPADVVARTPYCGGFVATISRRNIHGAQFHPEKSQRVGFRFIRNFLSL
jgi:glutamine amidotransferase